jgi:hypothetical protein
MSVAPPGWNPDQNHAAGATPAQNATQLDAYEPPAAAAGAAQFNAYDPPAAAAGAAQFAAAPVARPTLIQRNSTTFTTILVVALYLVLAKTTGIVLIGIFPAMLAFRALQRREPLAVVAVASAAVAIVFSLAVVARH